MCKYRDFLYLHKDGVIDRNVLVNYSLLTGTVPVNNSLLTGTVPACAGGVDYATPSLALLAPAYAVLGAPLLRRGRRYRKPPACY